MAREGEGALVAVEEGVDLLSQTTSPQVPYPTLRTKHNPKIRESNQDQNLPIVRSYFMIPFRAVLTIVFISPGTSHCNTFLHRGQ